MPKKRTLLFFAVVIISFVLMTYQSKKGYIPSGNIFNVFLGGSQTIMQSVSDAFKRPFVRMALREEENVRLKRQIADLLQERGKFQEAILENKRLTELLKLGESSRNSVSSARIIGRDIVQWTHTLLLDKGQKDGVGKDMAAITPRGLAGKITNVSVSYSYLLLLTDINFAAAVRLQESRKEGILAGNGTRICGLKYIPYEEEVKPGDIVITSGLDLLFPAGIPVGYVSKVDNRGRGGNFQYIEVIPFQDDTKMEEVLIIR
ncbi:MAG: rod shape-determining protein MreC [Nitrospirae bacterium]|nr:rod shape-determining protein MreC [Nitrospirota bacterium]